MPNKRDIEILNTSQFKADMDRVDDALRDRILAKGVNKALTPIVRAAKKNVTPHKRSGLYRKSINRKVKRYRSGVAIGLVGPDVAIVGQFEGSKAWPQKYAHLVEHGTQPHKLGKGSQMERADRPRQKEVQRGAKHPGSKAFYPLTRAADQSRAQAVQAYADTVADELKKLETR